MPLLSPQLPTLQSTGRGFGNQHIGNRKKGFSRNNTGRKGKMMKIITPRQAPEYLILLGSAQNNMGLHSKATLWASRGAH